MRVSKVILIIILLTPVVFTSGCWSRTELNEIGILSGLGIKDGGEAHKLTLVYQIVNPTPKSATISKTPFFTIETSGDTVFEAIRKGTKEMPRKLYFGHVQAFIISSEYAQKEGIISVLDLFYRDPEIRENIVLFVTKEGQNVKNILSSQSILENNSGISIQKHLENTHKNEGCAGPVELRKVISSLISPTPYFVLPRVYQSPPMEMYKLDITQDAKQESVIKVDGYGIFNKGKLIGYLDSRDSRAYNFITDDIEATVIVVDYNGVKNSIEIMDSKTDIKASLKQGKPEILIEIENFGNVGEMNAPIDLTKTESIKLLEESANSVVERDVMNTINTVKEKYKIDIFHFADEMRMQNPKEWQKTKDSWDELFLDVKVEVEVKTTIYQVGIKNRSFHLEMESLK